MIKGAPVALKQRILSVALLGTQNRLGSCQERLVEEMGPFLGLFWPFSADWAGRTAQEPQGDWKTQSSREATPMNASVV